MTELPDRLLRDALRPGPLDPTDACVDADALAAWSDGTMSRAARAAFETHAADCARCQALMAAMARTAPPPVEPAWWRRARFSWMMPLAAATAAIVIVVSLSNNGRPVQAPQIARNEPAPAVRQRTDETGQQKAVAAPEPARPAPQAPAPANQNARRERFERTAPSPTTRSTDQPKDAVGFSAPKVEQRAQDASANAVPVPAPASSPAPPPPPIPAPATAAPAAAASEASAERGLGAAAPAASGGAASADAAQYRAGLRQESKAMMKAANQPALLVIASPVQGSQWRIVGSAVAYTDDGGVKWQTQALEAGVSIRAGASPAARVCWLAGASGVVLLTTDALHWRRLAFPEVVDLIAIEAADASRATVTTAAGARFRTSDGGASWTRQ